MSEDNEKRAELFGTKQQEDEEDKVGSDDEFEASKVEAYY